MMPESRTHPIETRQNDSMLGINVDGLVRFCVNRQMVVSDAALHLLKA